MQKKNILVFDFDGTIVNSTELEHTALLNTIHEYGFSDITKDNLECYFGPTESGILKNILGEDNFPEAWAYFIEDYLRLQDTLLKRIPGMDQLLKDLSLRKDILLVLVTGRSKETCDISLSYLGYDNYFSKVYTGSDEGINKGDNMNLLIENYGVQKHNIIYIGDTVADIKTLFQEGIDILSVSYSEFEKSRKEELEELNPGNVVHTVEELRTRLFALIEE